QTEHSVDDDAATREHDVRDIADALVVRRGAKEPVVGPCAKPYRIVEVEQCHADAVESAAHRLAHPVVHEQPAFRRLDRRWPDADAGVIPPPAGATGHHSLRGTPRLEVLGA